MAKANLSKNVPEESSAIPSATVETDLETKITGIGKAILPIAAAFFLAACSGQSVEPPVVEVLESESTNDGVSISKTEIVKGVPARGQDPSVVALRIDNTALCTGVLIAKDVVLTARHCVARTSESVICPAIGPQVFAPFDPGQIEVVLGDAFVGQPSAGVGREIVVPTGATLCGADIALVVLAEPIANVRPSAVSSVTPKRSDHVRAVGFGKLGDNAGAGRKYVREHVPIVSISTEEFLVGEATCQGDSGGPAFDEDTGAVVGVVSRGGPSCEGPDVHNIYTRVDAYSWLIDLALSKSGKPNKADSGTPGAPRASPKKPSSDVGSECEAAGDCAANVCIRGPETAYCSRRCGSGDRCPTGFHCRKVQNESYCVRAR
jgi:hypothetical protein